MPAVRKNKTIDKLAPDEKELVELASGQKITELDIDDVNEFLSGYYLFHKGITENER